MKILLIIEGTYPWYRGGVSEWVYRYLKNLTSCSFEILQIATDVFSELNPEHALYPLTDNITGFHRISPPDIDRDWSVNSLKDWYEDNADIMRSALSGSDIIHVTNTGFAGWLGAHLSENTEIPLLLTEHAIYWKEVEKGAVALECGYKIPRKQGLKSRVIQSFKEIASITYNTAQQIVTVSNSNIPYEKKLGAGSINYIPNGIPASWLLEHKDRDEAPVIAWVGRCAEMKNPLKFLEVVEAFRDSDINPRFQMLLSDANEKKLEEQVKVLSQTYEELEVIWNQPAKDYFPAFDFLFITSHNESQPLVMLEALAHKALPVGWQVGDLTERYGLVFEAGTSVHSVTGQVEKLWNSQEEFEAKVARGFELVKKEHTWEQIFDQYRVLFDEILSDKIEAGAA